MLRRINTEGTEAKYERPMEDWQPISSAPMGSDLELSVIEKGEVHALAFACRRVQDGWVRAATGEAVRVLPSHWRHWEVERA